MASLTREQIETITAVGEWCDQRAEEIGRRRTNRIANATLAVSWQFAAAAVRLYIRQHS
jgi:hypothetical protein